MRSRPANQRTEKQEGPNLRPSSMAMEKTRSTVQPKKRQKPRISYPTAGERDGANQEGVCWEDWGLQKARRTGNGGPCIQKTSRFPTPDLIRREGKDHRGVPQQKYKPPPETSRLQTPR